MQATTKQKKTEMTVKPTALHYAGKKKQKTQISVPSKNCSGHRCENYFGSTSLFESITSCLVLSLPFNTFVPPRILSCPSYVSVHFS